MCSSCHSNKSDVYRGHPCPQPGQGCPGIRRTSVIIQYCINQLILRSHKRPVCSRKCMYTYVNRHDNCQERTCETEKFLYRNDADDIYENCCLFAWQNVRGRILNNIWLDTWSEWKWILGKDCEQNRWLLHQQQRLVRMEMNPWKGLQLAHVPA